MLFMSRYSWMLFLHLENYVFCQCPKFHNLVMVNFGLGLKSWLYCARLYEIILYFLIPGYVFTTLRGV